MKFAHLSDVHIGSWREPKMREANLLSFVKAVDLCIAEDVDFAIIAGDLFNTAVPAMDSLRVAVAKLKELSEKGIPVYVIAGSHDYSSTGKSMIGVLNEAGLVIDVMRGSVQDNKLHLKFTADKKTGIKLVGIAGRRGMLDRQYYDALEKEELEKEPGRKIFLFHTALTELKPRELAEMDSEPLSLLPKGFDYYAGGHVHAVLQKNVNDYGLISYPGPVFPNNFRELEKLEHGTLCIVDDSSGKFRVKVEPIVVCNVFAISHDCNHQNPSEIEQALFEVIDGKEFINTIVLIRLHGRLRSGKPADINFQKLFREMESKGAYFVMKNTMALLTKDFEQISTSALSVEEIESSLIKEHAGQLKLDSHPDTARLLAELMDALNAEKEEGERVADFENRVKENARKVLKLD